VTTKHPPVVVAVEGPCCAGKTTLARRLATQVQGLTVTFIPCYADHVGGGRYLPAQGAATVPEREEALRQLLAVEASRLAQARPDSDVILADRSVQTLLAHSYAMQVMTGVSFLAPSLRLLRSSAVPAWPDLVFYLDLPQPAVAGRNHGKFPPTSIYINPRFNAAVRAYFVRLAGPNYPRVVWLDAMLNPVRLAHQAETLLRQMVALRNAQGAR
jgi:thymidylate kinase